MDHRERQQTAWTTAATIMALAWPTIVEQVMQTAVQYIDTAMVGFLALIARSCGAGDLEAAKKATAQTSLVVLVAGIFATIVCTAVSGIVPVWMQVDPTIQELDGALSARQRPVPCPMCGAASILLGSSGGTP